MFGEQYIFGQKEMAIDKKGRVILPPFTYAEVKDEVVFSLSQDRDYLQIFLKQHISQKIDTLLNKQLTAKDLAELKIIQYEIDRIQNYCCGVESVDSQRRVLIPSILRKQMMLEGSVYMSGGVDLQMPCLEIYKNEKEMLSVMAKRKSFEY